MWILFAIIILTIVGIAFSTTLYGQRFSNDKDNNQYERFPMKKINWKKCLKRTALGLLIALVIIYFLPTGIKNPVEGCGRESYNQASFWHPWGDHKHRGIDIFAPKGTPVHPAIGGIVVATARDTKIGGNCVLIFSSGLRFHYYAHLSEIDTHIGAIVTHNSVIGKVGDTGNAAGKPPHLHYSISTFIPQGEDWHFDKGMMMVFINPIKELERSL